MAFFANFCPTYILKLTCLVTLFDRKLQVFINSPKWTIFGIFNELLTTQNVNAARFARNAKFDFFCDFQTLLHTLDFNLLSCLFCTSDILYFFGKPSFSSRCILVFQLLTNFDVLRQTFAILHQLQQTLQLVAAAVAQHSRLFLSSNRFCFQATLNEVYCIQSPKDYRAIWGPFLPTPPMIIESSFVGPALELINCTFCRAAH